MNSGAAESGEPDERQRVAHLYSALHAVGVELSPREVSDVLWLALHEPPNPANSTRPEPGTPPAPVGVPGPRRERDTTEPTPDEVRRPVYALTRTRDGGAPGAPRRIPAVRGLRHPLGVVRALRAFKRGVPSPHRFELDETATAEAIAESGVLDAVLRPARDRWLHLVLAVDDGPSMRVWRDTLVELAHALTLSGIFRSVRVSPLAAVALLSGERTAVLAVTDGVAEHWYTGSAHEHLATLARRAPTAVLHMFPTRLWSGTGLAAEPMIVRTTGLAPPNSLLIAHDPARPAASDPRLRLPVPVLELDELSLRPWAELVASHGGLAALRVIDAERAPGLSLDSDSGVGDDEQDGDAHDDDVVTGEPATAADRVRRFRAAASPHAYELAGHLAAVDPLTLPVMRLVQAAALPDTNPVCLSEVLLSGLMYVENPLEGHDVFAFPPDVRDVLRTVIRASSARHTVDAVSDFITPRLGRVPDFPALIADRTGTLTLPRGGQPLAELVPASSTHSGSGRSGSGAVWRNTNNLPARRTVRMLPVLRRDVDWVEQTLAGTSGFSAALCGPAGSDKTTVALEYAHCRLQDTSLVWWVDASEPRRVDEGIASITDALSPAVESAAGSDDIDAREWALRWLESHAGWLLVLDDVSATSKVTELVDRVGAYGRVLVTARVTPRRLGMPERDMTSGYRDRCDVLTGLRDRRTVREQLSALLCAAPRSDNDSRHPHLRLPSEDPEAGGRTVAVLFCALDGLESVNVRYGPAAGGAVLIEVARRLRHAVGDDDTVARVGDDQFVILAGGLDRTEAQTLVGRLRAEIIVPITGEGWTVRVGADFGARWAQCGVEADRVIEAAREGIHGRVRDAETMFLLTEALCALAFAEDREGRQAFAQLLAEQLRRPIDVRGLRQREDVVALVRAALGVVGGEEVLAQVVRVFEGDAAARELERLLDQVGPPADRSRTEPGAAVRAPDRLELLTVLVGALCELECVEDPLGRTQFAALLGELLGRAIEIRGVKTREDAVSLARGALQVSGGTHVLIDVIRILEGVPAADDVAGRISASSVLPMPRVLLTTEEDEARTHLRAVGPELSAVRLRDVLTRDLDGLGLPTGLSPEQLFAYTLELTAQPDGMPPAVLLVERASRLVDSPAHRSALAGWVEAWAANTGLSEALRRRRLAKHD